MEIMDWFRAIFALGVTLGLLGLGFVAARRFGMIQSVAPGAERRMKVVERLMLDPRRSLVIVKVDAQEHLVLLSPAGDRPIATLTQHSAPTEDASTAAQP
jgi:flagellar protein FliO/FliZ